MTESTTTERAPATALDPSTFSEPCQRVISLFNGLTRADLARMPEYYAPDVHFRDPFNDVRGLPAVTHIFEDMFDKLVEPKFTIVGGLESSMAAHQAFLTWDFDFGLGKRRCHAHGGSLLQFDANGQIRVHHDYWDAASGLYEHLPVLGAIMRTVRRRVQS